MGAKEGPAHGPVSPLFVAVWQRRPDVALALLKSGASVEGIVFFFGFKYMYKFVECNRGNSEKRV